MNLMKLLTVGQSLKEGKTVLGRYKLSQQTLLPKFASTICQSKKSPAVSTPPTEAKPAISAALVEIKKGVVPGVSEPERHSLESEKTQKIPVGTVLKRVEEKKVVLSRTNSPSPIKNKISALWNKWFPRRSRKRGDVFAVQTEWSLEKITVARNDLSDADLEIVARKTAERKPKAKPSFAEISREKDHGQRWIKMTARLFKRTSPFKQPEGQESGGAANRAELADRV